MLTMATPALGTAVHNLRRAVRRQEQAGLTDGDLLECFIALRDEGAFEALLRRHGPMVLGVCRRVLRNEADAEDAFQATFLVLVRKAASVRPRAMVGNWLYGVAHSTALKARAMSTKRRAKEREAALRPKPGLSEQARRELSALVDQELKALPDIYRAAIVACDLEGYSLKEAAGHLGCPQGTIGTRLARGRILLSRRLARHGPILASGVIATAIAQDAAGVPPLLLSSTVKAATLITAGQATAGGLVSAKVAALTEGVIMNLFPCRVRGVLATLTVALIGLAAWGSDLPVTTAPPVQPADRVAAGAHGARTGADLSQPVAAETKSAVEEGEPISAIWITDKRVQQELRLTEAQVKKLDAIRLAANRKYEAELKEAREEAKKHNYARYREATRKVQAEEKKALTEAAPGILSSSALRRLLQIQRQGRGLHHVIRESAVQKKLNLNDEQVKAIEGLLKQGLEEARKAAAERSTGPILAPLTIEDHIVMEQKAYAGAMKGVVGVFTEAQRRRWEELVGEPFAFKAAPAK
jgi:RNA polymerase sigma factor (sigma-70 family)